jgi:hypothetical protein
MKVIKNPHNMGLIATISRLLSEVMGDYFALADQDDVWDRNKLSSSLRQIQADMAMLVYSDVRIIDMEGRVLTPTYLKRRGLKPYLGHDPMPFVFRNPVVGHTIVARAMVAAAAKDIPLDLVFHEIWLIGWACRLGTVTYIDQSLGSYRQHSRNVIGAYPSLRGRMRRLLQTGVHLKRRQNTRSRALSALARIDPSLSPIATIMGRHGFARLANWPAYAIFIMSISSRIGLGSAFKEVVFFLVPPDHATSKGKGDIPSRSETDEQGATN